MIKIAEEMSYEIVYDISYEIPYEFPMELLVKFDEKYWYMKFHVNISTAMTAIIFTGLNLGIISFYAFAPNS